MLNVVLVVLCVLVLIIFLLEFVGPALSSGGFSRLGPCR
jgi:hypothetical protein